MSEFQDAYMRIEGGGSIRGVAAELQIPYSTLRDNYARWKEDNSGSLVIDHVPKKEQSLDDILAEKRSATQRMYDHMRAIKRIKVRVPVETGQAYGLLMFGDPHLDTNGCDFVRLEEDLGLLGNGVFGLNIGDITNNWVGRLVAQYANQKTTRSEAMQLMEWFIKRDGWLAHIAGNHDLWNYGTEVLAQLVKGQNVIFAENSCARLALVGGGVTCRIHARHEFKGNSQYNTAFGSVKAAYFGDDDHILVMGHKHVSGETAVYHDKTEVLSRCIALGTYKVFDPYAETGGFRKSNYAPSMLAIVQPQRQNQNGFVRIFDDPQEGNDYLQFLRK